MDARTLQEDVIKGYEEVFEELVGQGESTFSSLRDLRTNAFARFKESGFPTTRHEEWRFTNVTPIANTKFAFLDGTLSAKKITDISRWNIAGEDVASLVFVDGQWSEALSNIVALPKGVRFLPLSQAATNGAAEALDQLGRITDIDSNPFCALNTALFSEGVLITVPDGTTVRQPLLILMLTTPRLETLAVFPRILVNVGRQSSLSLVEIYGGGGSTPGLTDIVTEVFVGEGATVEHDRLQVESEAHYHMSTMTVRQEQGSVFLSNSITFGGGLVRNNVHVTLGGPGGECTLNGLAIGNGTQLIDNHTSIDHAADHCTSHELYKTILDGAAHGVFNGKIFVRPGAQKTDAKQTNKTVLLSNEALMNTKPQLEIFADDVKCTHGAAVGQLDDEQLFYLRTRGIGREEARAMLTQAFANDVIERIHVDAVRARLEHFLRSRLEGSRNEELS